MAARKRKAARSGVPGTAAPAERPAVAPTPLRPASVAVQPGRLRPLVVLSALALLVLAIFWQSKDFAFIGLDDLAYVAENPVVLRGLTADGLRWAFRTVHAGNWHPLTWISHMLDLELFGLAAGRHHLVNVGLHLLNAALLFLGLRALTGAVWRPAVVAAFFAVHPAHVESVAWVSERKDVLSTLLLLLTLLAYQRYARGRRQGWYLATVASFGLGLMAKPMLVTLPFLLLLLDFWPLGRLAPAAVGGRGPGRERTASLVVEKLPLFFLAVASSAVTFFAQRGSGAVASLEHLALGARLSNALVSYCRYLGIMVWPVDLAVIYPYPRSGYPAAVALAALAALATLTVLAFRQRRRRPFLLVGWLWYAGMLVPVIGLVQVGNQALADRYTYAPFIGLFLAIVWLLAATAERGPQRAALAAAAGAAVLALSLLARHQTAFWTDGITLMRHALAVTRDNHAAHFTLGSAYAKAGRLQEATAELTASISINPAVPSAHNDLGNVYAETGQPLLAAAAYRRALALQPDYYEATINLGVLALDLGDNAEAERLLGRITDRGMNIPEAFFNRGLALSGLGRVEEAIGMYRQAVVLRPNYARSLLQLATSLEGLGRVEEARPYRLRAESLTR